MKQDKQRDRAIAKRFVAGELLREIGLDYGMSRERVRQIVRRAGVTPQKRGQPQRRRDREKRQREHEKARKRAREQRIKDRWGISAQQYDKLRAYDDNLNRTPLGQYLYFKHSSKSRGVPFSLAFKDWWAVWRQHWHKRGRKDRDKLVTARKDFARPVERGNIRVIPAWQASRDFQNWRNARK